jgi:uncharacterized protein (TIGR02598 family)
MIIRPPVLRGFSLVEVVLALGIISFALVALLGITAVGTNAGLQSKWDTEGGQIFEQIMGQLRTKPFAESQDPDSELFPLPALNADDEKTFYLDDQNRVVSEGAATRKVVVSSKASVQLPYLDASGAMQSAPNRDALALVMVEISPYPPRSAGDKSVYFAEVCRLEQ